MADPRSQHERVDYERVAPAYDRGRTLPPASMARWRDAVHARLGDGALRRVVDVGAGTGLFLPMWLDLGAETIVAVEPAAAMRAQASSRPDPRIRVVDGTAADLRLDDASVDALWLSAVIHHVPDIDAAAAEMRRVLRPGGRLFVRGFFPDHSSVPWLEALPGADRARARFPTTARVAAALRRAGFSILDVVGIPEPEGPLAREAADWIAKMRNADSILIALRDEEVDAGIAALRAQGDSRLEPLRLSLVTAVASVT